MAHHYAEKFSTEAGKGAVTAGLSNKYGEENLGTARINVRYSREKSDAFTAQFTQNHYQHGDEAPKVGISRRSWYDENLKGEITDDALEDLKGVASKVNDKAYRTVVQIGPENSNSKQKIVDYMPDHLPVYRSGTATRVLGVGLDMAGFEELLEDVEPGMALEVVGNEMLEEAAEAVEEELRKTQKYPGPF